MLSELHKFFHQTFYRPLFGLGVRNHLINLG